MAKYMEHWNGNPMCCIDCETTGLDPYINEIIQVCLLPLDSNLNIREDVIPFYINIKPENTKAINLKAMHCNKIDLNKIMVDGFDREAAKDMLYEWYSKLATNFTRWGTKMRIIPIGQNYAFDMMFMKRWLGVEMYDDIFRHDYRDTMLAATYLNDRAAMHNQVIPYSKVNLTWLASRYHIEYSRKHDALSDCVATAKTYQKMIQLGLLD